MAIFGMVVYEVVYEFVYVYFDDRIVISFKV